MSRGVGRSAYALVAAGAAFCAAAPGCRNSSAPDPTDRVPTANHRVISDTSDPPVGFSHTFLLKTGPVFAGTATWTWNGGTELRMFSLERGRLAFIDEPLDSITGSWVSPQGNLYVAGGPLYRFDGTDWQVIAPAAGTVNGRSENDLYAAVGNAVKHYDGTTWTPVFVPTRAVTDLHALPAGGVVVAAGDSVFICTPDSITRRRMTDAVRDVWASAPDDVWALVGTDGPWRDVWHFDGLDWAFSFTATLRAIDGNSADDVYAISRRGLRHFDGTAWTPNWTYSWRVTLSMAVSDTAVWIGQSAASALRWDGTSLRSVPGPPPADPFVIVPSSAGRFAIADFSEGVFISDRNGGFLDLRFDHRASAFIGGNGMSNMYVVADSIYRYDGTSLINLGDWGRRVVGTPMSMWSDGAGHLLVGARWGFTRFDGSLWTAVESIGAGGTDAVWGSGPDDLYAVWRGLSVSEIWHFDGARWAVTDTLEVAAISGTGPRNVYAAGASGVWHHGQTGWSRRDIPMPGAYRYLATHPARGVVACTGEINGTALLYALDAPSPELVRVPVRGSIRDFEVGADGAFYLLTEQQVIRVDAW